MILKDWLKDARDLVFPILCATCQRVEPDEDHLLCRPCIQQLSWIDSYKDAKAALVGKAYFPKDILHFDSLLYYTKSSRAQYLLKAIKYWGNSELAMFLGSKLSDNLDTDNLPNQATLIPVPLHPRRLKERGYNQAEEIAKGIITRQPNWKIDNHLLKRNIYESSQTKKGAQERSAILDKSFSVMSSSLPIDSHLILIDDVITTGATVGACVSLLRDAGYHKISILSLAISI